MASSATYLSQDDAVKLDEELMGPLGFSVDQLMELAGLSVASAVASEVPAASRILILAGPGNNGGDGLVAARHLHHFGHKVQICYPKPSQKELFEGLVTQCTSLKLPFVAADDLPRSRLSRHYDAVVDAMFGFSFKGDPRPPFDELLQLVVQHAEGCYLAAVDIPSGWDVEQGPPAQGAMRPDMLISLTAPKKGCQHFKGTHYLGGRFVPPAIKERFHLQLPEFPGTAQCVKLAGNAPEQEAAGGVDVAGMRQDDRNMAGGLDESTVLRDPIEQFGRWMAEAARLPDTAEPNAVCLATAAKAGHPSNRMVLLKGYDERGFTFFTNYGSRKGGELASGAHAALCFYWEPLQRQVRVEGVAQRLSEGESAEYYHARPRGSQIGAWCSAQSSVISGRQELEERLHELQEKYADASQPIPKPDFWGGFRVVPTRIEFWHARPNRLHDRLCFSRVAADAEWTMQRLSP